MNRYKSFAALLSTLAVVSVAGPVAAVVTVPSVTSNPTADDLAIPKYDYIFNIIEENHAYSQIIGDTVSAPNINALAAQYGLATNFYGEVHPSEANYIALLGGSTFGIHDDDAYYCTPGSKLAYCSGSSNADYVNHTITSASLVDQLEAKGLTWKGYFGNIPQPYQPYLNNNTSTPNTDAVYYPQTPTATDPAQLYGAKHNGFINYAKLQTGSELQNYVSLDRLATDLQNGNVANYVHIVPNQCDEMHGLGGTNVPSDCNISNDSGPNARIHRGDAVVGQLVSEIQSSNLWKSGNNAIVITWDEDNNPSVKTGTQGCCGYDPTSNANFGGGHIATVVITNNGIKGVVDSTPYNHYSLLRTTEDAFGIYSYLNYAGDTADGVKPLTSLFAPSAASVPEPSFTFIEVLALSVLGAGWQLKHQLKK